MASTTEDVQQNESLTEKQLENDVLRLRIEVMKENHSTETRKLVQEKDNEINEMKIKHDEQDVRIEEQVDIIKEQETEIKLLNQRSAELQQKIDQLDKELKTTIKKSTRAAKAKEAELRKLETELKAMGDKIKEMKDEIKLIKTGIDEKQKKELENIVENGNQKLLANLECSIQRQLADVVNTVKTAQQVNINTAQSVQIGDKGQMRSYLKTSKCNLKFPK